MAVPEFGSYNKGGPQTAAIEREANMVRDKPSERPWIIMGLILMGVVARLVPHPPNVTPLTAIALFGGTYLSRRWAVLLPLSIVGISDLLLGWDAAIPFSWAAFALTGLVAWWVRARPGPGRIAAGALAGSVAFFLITNFGVWLIGELYPRTTAGFWECYVAAIPFFRNTVMGDLVYTAVFFGSYALITRPRLTHHRVPSH